MKTRRLLGASFLLTLLVWLFYSWPLPRYATHGIPCSATNVEKGGVRQMVAGDHLQLLYNYWVFSDMLSGKTPLFYNLYEFNTGDDSERRYVGLDLLPFSLIFTGGYWLAGRAAGWNLMGFVSLWLTLLFTWLLVRQFVKSGPVSALVSVVAITLPYRWVALLGGSPTGLAMMIVPMLLLGLTLAVRQRRIWGGVLAALAVLFAKWNDVHILMFGLMLTPFWCLMALAADPDVRWRDYRYWVRMVLALLPFALVALVVVVAMMGSGEAIGDSTVAEGRSLGEVALYSPKAVGLIGWRMGGDENSIYLGYALGVIALLGFVGWLMRLLVEDKPPFRRAAVWTALLLLCVGVVALALGPNGPAQGAAFRLLRLHVPHFDMIRQPAKIYALLPPLLAVFLGMSMVAGIELVPRRGRYWLLVGLCLAFAFEHQRQVRPTVCLLDDEQDACAAVAQDARVAGKDPRAIMIPIWPGDSAWASLYQHHVSLYRIRMMNGYLPVVPQKFVTEIANVFEFLNGGIVTDELLDKLQARGVDYVMLYEDAFPEQCSTFSVGFTLKRFLQHPRLALLKQGQNVWAFKILPAPRDTGANVPDWSIFTPTYNAHHEAESCDHEGALVIHEPGVSADYFVRLNAPTGALSIASFYHCNPAAPVFFVRVRGDASLELVLTTDERAAAPVPIEIESGSTWRWIPVELTLPGSGQQVRATFRARRGIADLDTVIYGAGRIPDLGVGDSYVLPAAVLCHSGYTDLDANAVQLRAAYQPTGNDHGVIYGPNIPIATGRYRYEVKYSTDAGDGVDLGYCYIYDGKTRTPDRRIVSGSPVVGEFVFDGSSMELRFVLNYSRNADMKVHSLVLTRVE